MSKEITMSFRASDHDRLILDAIAKRLGKSKSDTMRTIINEFGVALGVAPGKAKIRVTVETVGELEY